MARSSFLLVAGVTLAGGTRGNDASEVKNACTAGFTRAGAMTAPASGQQNSWVDSAGWRKAAIAMVEWLHKRALCVVMVCPCAKPICNNHRGSGTQSIKIRYQNCVGHRVFRFSQFQWKDCCRCNDSGIQLTAHQWFELAPPQRSDKSRFWNRNVLVQRLCPVGCDCLTTMSSSAPTVRDLRIRFCDSPGG